MSTSTRDRLKDLLAQGTLSAIDFVEIADASETTLIVHFVTAAIVLKNQLTRVSITGGETIPTVDVLPISDADWSNDAFGKTTLTLRVRAPGDFSTYMLTLASPFIDEYFDHIPFSFKALCPRDIDCQVPGPACPPEPVQAPPIDYLAKDFQSFRRALSDFSALRYPAWQERSEADFGVMFMEALCSVADDLSYQQDRLAAEAYLDTATERRSIVRHARLVDYEPRPATAATVLLRFDVIAGPIPAGLTVHAATTEGVPIEFETGTGLADTTSYDVRPEWNAIPMYYWDDQARCLERGATELWLEGDSATLGLVPGSLALLETPAEAGDLPLRQVVTLLSVIADRDEVYGKPLTRVVFREPLEHARDLTKSTLSANLVPATQGKRAAEEFAIESSTVQGRTLALVRTGPNGTAQYLHSLAGAPLVYLEGQGTPTPELRLSRTDVLENWRFVRRLLDAEPFPAQPLYTVDPVSYIDIGSGSDGQRHFEYDGSNGSTLRFGDGVFGDIPVVGAQFSVEYRVGGGAVGNVAADSITSIEPNSVLASRARAVSNPFAASGGADAEPDETVRRLAPQAFRAQQFRAVRAEDYAAAAETLTDIERAGTAFRWTGSWLSVFTSVEPLATELPSEALTRDLVSLLNRYRMTGYESFVLPPRYASLDVIVTVCARHDAFRGDVTRALQLALSSTRGGFFEHDRFVFGQPLERSQLEAAIQNTHGVDGVLDIQYCRRGMTRGFVVMPSRVVVASNEIVRADGDPSRADAGSVTVIVRGGK